VLSHELRNPLAPIQNSLYIAARAAPGSETTRRALAVIERQVHQLTRLVDDLLDVTRIARGKIRLRREKVDLRALAGRTAEDYRALFSKNGLELEVVLGDEPLFVNADPTRLTQIIGNLLHNAMKFTPAGSRTTLSVRRADEASAEISVEDRGHGIATDVLAQLFEPFVQAEKTLERCAGGLGLGLALVKGLVELHGGSVSAHSAGPGQGARFDVRIPLERRKAPRLTLVQTPKSPSPARRVLVIEDNVDAAETLKEALELNDHRVEVAFTGPEGLEKARTFKPDVVLCDIGLPGLNGFEVARAIRGDPELGSITLVALSGYALPEDIDRAKAAGFDLHVPKPPDLVALERSIAEARAQRDTA
jgi:CheY-like chemotaxis protein